MGILNFKLSKDIDIEPPKDTNVGEDYVTTFNKEQSRGDFPLKDEKGRILQQVRLHGDYLISKMGTSEENKRRGYENFYQFLEKLPQDMRLVYRKPNQDPYDDNYYRKLGLEKKNIDDYVYYVGENPSEVQANTQTYMYSHGSSLDKKDKNPQLMIPYLSLDNEVPQIDFNVQAIVENILNFLRINRNRCITERFEAGFYNNFRAMIAALSAARERSGAFEEKVGGGNPMEDFSNELIRLLEMIPIDSPPIRNLARKIRNIRSLDEYNQVVSEFQSEWRYFEREHPEIFKYKSYGEKNDVNRDICVDILEERHGKNTAKLAKERFQRRIDQIYALTNREPTSNPTEKDQRLKFIVKFGQEVEDAENALIANDWDVLHAAAELELEGNSVYPDDYVQNMLNAHARRKQSPEQKESRDKYAKLQIVTNDGKSFVYDSTVINSDNGPVARDTNRYQKWKYIIDLYNKQDLATQSNQMVKVAGANLALYSLL